MKASLEIIQIGTKNKLIKIHGQCINSYVIIPKDADISAFTTERESWKFFYQKESDKVE